MLYNIITDLTAATVSESYVSSMTAKFTAKRPPPYDFTCCVLLVLEAVKQKKMQ